MVSEAKEEEFKNAFEKRVFGETPAIKVLAEPYEVVDKDQ